MNWRTCNHDNRVNTGPFTQYCPDCGAYTDGMFKDAGEPATYGMLHWHAPAVTGHTPEFLQPGETEEEL